MAPVYLALGASVVAAIGGGCLAALSVHVHGLRPMAWLRDLSRRRRRLLSALTVLAGLTGVASVATEPPGARGLALVSLAVAILVASAVLVLLLENDEGWNGDDGEPEWWPDFERRLRAWERSTSSRA